MESGSDPTLVTAPADEVPVEGEPTSIGRHRIDRRIGAGGMGVVWLGHDPVLDRPVALKLLRGIAGAHELERIQREARAAAAVVHPNVVTVFDVGTANGRVFVAMEYVEGESLAQWLKTPRSWRAVLAVLVQCARALAAAHRAGIVHRDFKPDNALVDREGRVKVVDFGIAAATETSRSDAATDPESVATPSATRWHGSPAYMAPERHAGARGDEKSDQFSFGVTAFEALWGRRPFEGDSVVEVVASICDGRIVRVPRGPVPAAVRRAVLRSLASRPADRHRDMDALADALARAGRGRVRVLVAVGAVGLAALATIAVTRPRDCGGGEAHLQEIDGLRARLRTRWAELPALSEQLEAWREAWTQTHREVCEDARRSADGAALLDRRMACLQRERAAMQSTLEVASEHAGDGRAAAALLRSLAEPTRCRDDPDPMIADGSGELQAIEADRARAHALWLLGVVDVAAPLAADVMRRADAHPGTPTWVRAATLHATLLIQLGRTAEAEPLVEQAYAQAVALHDDAGALMAIQTQATLAYAREDGPALLLCARRAQVQAARVANDPNEMPATIDAMLAAGHRVIGDYETAIVHGRRAAERADRQAVADYASVAAHVDLAGTFMTSGRYAEAELELMRAEQNAKLLPVRAGDPRALEATVARLELMRGRPDRALERLLATAARIEAAHESETENARTVVCMIQDTLRELGDAALALRYARKCEAAGGADNRNGPAYGRSQIRLAIALADTGRLDEALQHIARAIATLEAVQGDRHHELAAAFAVSGRLLRERGDADRADAAERRALELFERVNRGGVSHLAALLGVGRGAIDRGDLERAAELLDRGFELATVRQGPAGPDTLLLSAQRLRLRVRAGEPRASVRAEALALREPLAPLLGVEVGYAKAALAEVLGERPR